MNEKRFQPLPPSFIGDSIATKPVEYEQESKQNRQVRKEEAKRLKRKRIEEAGGKRPRNNESMIHRKKPKSKTKKKQQQPQQNHGRFGKVMDKVPCPNKPRLSTLSIAIPGSVVSNAQTQELRTHLVGQIARAAAVYHVDEIIVFDDNLAQEIKPSFHSRGYRNRRQEGHNRDNHEKDTDKDGAKARQPRREESTSVDPHTFMARILQYCECPQYLRRHFFPMRPDLQFAGLLPPLDAPHHVRILDRSPFREGVVLEKKGTRENAGSLVSCGIRSQDIEIDRILSPGIRCTVQIDPKAYQTPGKRMTGKVVSPSTPRERNGTYWGYTTRLASSISAIFDESPYEGGYDLKIGTSERGDSSVDDNDFVENHMTSPFEHALIVFGGVAGIEECVDADETLKLAGSESKTLFHQWVNVCPYQGSRTIRSEEAVLISLARLRPILFSTTRKNISKSSAKSNLNSIQSNESISSKVEFSDNELSGESSSEE